MTTNKPQVDEWVKPGVAASALGVSPRTLLRLAERGDVKSIRMPSGHSRYSAASIEAIIAGEPWEPAS